MKQLRFRIWDVKQKKFIFEYEASHLRLAITLAGKVYRGEDDNILPESDYVIQQYTGLNDINDIEIYEGDIVKYRDGSHQAPYYDKVIVEWKNKEDDTCDYTGWKIADTFFQGGPFEVIGNIFETPELLEQ